MNSRTPFLGGRVAKVLVAFGPGAAVPARPLYTNPMELDRLVC